MISPGGVPSVFFKQALSQVSQEPAGTCLQSVLRRSSAAEQ